MESTTSAIGYKTVQEALQESVVRENRMLRSMWRVAGNTVVTSVRQSSTLQLLEDIRQPIKAKPGKPEKYDYEYKRRGTCNIFVAVAPKAGIRIVKVTDTRTKEDFAYFIEDLVKKHFLKARCIQLVLDNLNTHFEGSLIETFGQRKAARLQKRIKFIYTPKHGSWLNMAEIEINIMDRQCTGGRIGSQEKLTTDLCVWSKRRNETGCPIDWKFTRQDADKKLSRHYVA